MDDLTKKKLTRLTRHFLISYKKSFAKENPHRITKVTKKLSKNKANKPMNMGKETRKVFALYCRAFNLALRKGLDLRNDVVIRSDYYGY